MPRKMDYERAKLDKKDAAHAFTLVSITRFGNPHGMQLQPWKPGKARGASKGGQWLCDVCCKPQRGSKHDHKNVCQGFVPYRGKSAT
jgi:hypothetical protein